nr:hypothetical protein CFP56_17046 [Quercus suber]
MVEACSDERAVPRLPSLPSGKLETMEILREIHFVWHLGKMIPRIDGIKGPLMECNDMADKLTSSIFNEVSYVYWLGLQGQLANLVVPDHLRISQLNEETI